MGSGVVTTVEPATRNVYLGARIVFPPIQRRLSIRPRVNVSRRPRSRWQFDGRDDESVNDDGFEDSRRPADHAFLSPPGPPRFFIGDEMICV
ncbi:protein UL21A [Saimiriine betaherpesvirus 4]|uniref:Protein UL21A n=1 Tax=Saimiriine betaherpesvirus 4 TaxID=1535247 RepID=G8XST4_9BETA|nr:protein UL21A [Saimiriine betaherpesvirus 4]AEV80881.1 protein UL21A [Saimiriine betaherpesvirus 4]